MSIMRALTLLLAALLAGCENGTLAITDDQRAAVKAKTDERQQARKAAFADCMTLAAKLTRNSDDDVAEVVDECGREAYKQTYHIR